MWPRWRRCQPPNQHKNIVAVYFKHLLKDLTEMESCLCKCKRQKLFRNELGPLHLYNCLWQTTCCHQFPLLHTCAHQVLEKASARTCACWPAVERVWKALDCGAVSAISSIASTEISTNHRSSAFHDRKSLLKFSELSCLTLLEPNSFISLSVHIISFVHCFALVGWCHD